MMTQNQKLTDFLPDLQTVGENFIKFLTSLVLRTS